MEEPSVSFCPIALLLERVADLYSPAVDTDFPCFHIDLATAVAAADRTKE